jgi:hypothetical protein
VKSAALVAALLVVAAGHALIGVRGEAVSAPVLSSAALDSLLQELPAARARLRNLCYGLALDSGRSPEKECDEEKLDNQNAPY